MQARQTVGDIQVQLKELEVKSTETQRQYLDNLRSISDLQAQQQELDTKAKRLDQENLESTNQRNKEIQEVNREITRLEQQIATNSRIVSAHSGCILEIIATVGQVVQPGTRLGNMQIENQDSTLVGISYFPVKDGKQIQAGMNLLSTPDTVQRERFGDVVGKITNVSALPVTTEGANFVIGNPEVVKTLIGEAAAIEVRSNLKIDSSTSSGYKWSSSQGPVSKITPGTTATVRVTIEVRAPITFVLPILRDFTGMK